MSITRILIADSHHGVFIPQLVTNGELHNPNWNWSDVSVSDIESLVQGPENPWYWDAWINVLERVVITDPESGSEYFLEENDGDLWAVIKTKQAELVELTEPSTDDIWDAEDETMREHEFFAIRIIRDGRARPLKFYQVHCFGSDDAYFSSSIKAWEISDIAQEVFRQSFPDETW